MEIIEQLKEKVNEIVEKIKNDKDLAAKFRKDPVVTVEELLGINLPDEQIAKVVEWSGRRLTWISWAMPWVV